MMTVLIAQCSGLFRQNVEGNNKQVPSVSITFARWKPKSAALVPGAAHNARDADYINCQLESKLSDQPASDGNERH